MDQRVTRAWRLYDAGVSYNSRLTPDQYSLVETNVAFFAGDQWRGLPDTPAMRRLPKPTFNILKRVASLFIASLTSSGVTMRVEPLARYAARGMMEDIGGHGMEGDQDASDLINAALENILEKLKFDYRVRDALFDGAQTGDYCAHFWFDPDAPAYGGADLGAQGEIRMELVDGINVIFGDPNVRDVERQPYILLVGRDTVRSLREEARRYRSGDADAVLEDDETERIPGTGGKVELEADRELESGKALYVLLYERI